MVGGVVRCNFGSVAGNSQVTASIVVQPTAVGQITNTFRVGGSSADANALNNVSTVVTLATIPIANLEPNGAQLVGDASGGIEAGETVTVNLTLRNVGSAATANLVASLLEGNAISAASGPQNYGAIAVGTNVSRGFTFTATGNAGETISAVLQFRMASRSARRRSSSGSAGK